MTELEVIAAALAAGAAAPPGEAVVVDAYAGLRRRLDGARGEPDAGTLAAARALLALADPAGTAAGKYVVDVSGARAVQVGDGNVQVENNYGVAAQTMTGPVTISYGQVPVPPTQPGA